jgi:hypothetical protein
MADAVWTYIDIHGEISSAESFMTLVEALSMTGEIRIGDRNVSRDSGAIRQALVDANLEDKPLHIRCQTRNGDTELFEKAGKQGIDLRVKTSGWGGEGPSVFFVKGGRKSLTLTEDGGEVAISHKLVRALMHRGVDSLSALDDFLSLYCAEAPDFRISDDVIRELYIPSRSTP